MYLSALVGSFSQGADDNPTVAMIEAAFAEAGLNARYINCEVAPEDLGDAVRGARAMGWLGFNCSIPHKLAVMEYLDGLGKSAELIGAVNCVVRQGDLLVGENTDGRGFLEALRPVRDPAGCHVVVLGAGGAGRAIAVELGLAGASVVTIVNRDEARGRDLAKTVARGTRANSTWVPWQETFEVPAAVDVLVNATSVGLTPNSAELPDVDLRTLRPDLVVADVVYNPPTTRLLEEAARRGATPVDGLGMLVEQGVLSVRYWTGTEPDRAVMRHTLVQAFGLEG